VIYSYRVHSVFSGVPIAQFVIVCVVLWRLLLVLLSLFLMIIVLSILLRIMASIYPFDIFKPLVIAVFVLLRILWYLQTFGHCSVCPSSYPLISSNLWSLQCLSFFVSFGIFKMFLTLSEYILNSTCKSWFYAIVQQCTRFL
jgi:hypothetical protein